MTSEEILKKVRKIEIKTQSLSRNIFAGEYHSQFKGRGMAFSEVREYQAGDDIRSIDWNVTARLNKPYVKIYEEERELTVMLLVDVSGSRLFGTSQYKRDIMTEVAATLAFSTIENNDKVGVIFFSDQIEKYIPPKKGRTHVLHIIRELLCFEPKSRGTNIAQALEYFANAQKRRTTAFLISDCMDSHLQNVTSRNHPMEKPLMIANRRHELNLIQIYDPRDEELPDVGLIKCLDAETGEQIWIDTSVERVRKQYHDTWLRQQEQLHTLLTKTGVRNVEIPTHEDYVKALMRLFQKK